MPQLWIVCRSDDGAVQVELRSLDGACEHHDHAELAAACPDAANENEHGLPTIAAGRSCTHSDLLLDTPPVPRAERIATPRAEANAWATFLLAIAESSPRHLNSGADADPPPLPPDRQRRRSLTTTRLLV